MNDNSMLEYMTVWESKIWTKSILYEGEEILNLDDQMTKLWDILDSDPKKIGEEIRELRDNQRIREYFFVISLNKARDWIDEGSKYDNSMIDWLKRIDKELPYVKEIRNMREHEIEYYRQKGRKQNKFFSSKGNHETDATSSFCNEEGYFIGGRIKVQKAIGIFKDFKQFIEIKFKSRYH